MEPWCEMASSLWANVLSMENNLYIHLFILTVIFDVTTGNLRGFLNNNYEKLNSSKGIKGLLKHLVVLVIVLTIYPYLTVVNFDSYANTLVVFYITSYGISILENLDQMGIKLPDWIVNRLEKAQNKPVSK